MARNLAAANLTQSQAASLTPVLFAFLDFDEGAERFHSGIGTIVTLGQSWAGVGDFGSLEAIEESDELSPFAIRMGLSGISSTLVTRAQNSDIYGRQATVYIGFMTDGTLVANPDVIWDGTMDTMSVKRGKSNEVVIQCESDLKFFDRANGLLFNDEDQQKLSSGDVGFEYLDQMMEAEIIWRGARAQFGSYPVPEREDREW